MHFALPPRKTSNPPVYARAAAKSSLTERQRRRIQQIVTGGIILLVLFSLLEFFHTSSPSHHGDETIQENQEVVIVTLFDDRTAKPALMEMVRANRDDYASRHGYQTFYTNTTTYHNAIGVSPSSWSLIPCLRHAMNLYPTATFLWFLDPHALITNPSKSLHNHIFQPLESIMIKDVPVVPPDSVIHTYSHLKPSDVYLIISQDLDNLAHTSFILRNTPIQDPTITTDNWAHFFLDAWFDPLYRMYGFQKAENHALEHMIQWHPTILTKVALIPQRTFNSYNFNYSTVPEEGKDEPVRTHDSKWQDGDLVVNFRGCAESRERDCVKEMKEYYEIWKKEVRKIDGKKKKKKEKGSGDGGGDD